MSAVAEAEVSVEAWVASEAVADLAVAAVLAAVVVSVAEAVASEAVVRPEAGKYEGIMKVTKISKQDMDRISQAVKKAEGNTSGEIVPYLVATSDEYEEVQFKSTILFTLAPLAILGILSYAWLLPFPVNLLEVVLAVLGFGVIGYFLPVILPSFKRLLLSERRLQNAVERRALSAFLEQEVFSTENRTGILIFISQFEHMVEVIGDTGINGKVNPDDWQQVVQLIIQGIKDKEPVEGILKGIEKCGILLASAGVDKPPDNPNELPDGLRIG